MKQSELLKKGKEILSNKKINEPDEKASKLLQYILNQTREEIIINSFEEVSKNYEEDYLKELEKIINGMPLQYITHKQEFMGLDFYVDENVLIPQPDTEILVEEAINLIHSFEKIDKVQVLDLCTGSGAIAVSIIKYVPNVKVFASDISKKALEVANKNVINNKVKNVELLESDMFENLKNYKFDFIVSNPPYIESNTIKNLSKEVQNEPKIALDGGQDGLKFYRIILKEAYKYLNKNGYLLLEIGYDQGEKILKLCKEYSCNLNLITKKPIKDFGGNNRVIILQKEGE